jgi:indole-3-glycerol phosphate synthase
MSDILDRILATKREEIAAAQAAEPLDALRRRAEAAPAPRDFVGALRGKIAQGKPAVIAEIKKASPSKGVLREDFRPADIAASYERGGAACLSVLTDREYFQGSPDYLIQARAACALPVLRKDFIVDPYQVFEARAMGADCILLIVAAFALPPPPAGPLGFASPPGGEGSKTSPSPSGRGVGERGGVGAERPQPPSGRGERESARLVITESGILAPEHVALMRQHGVNAFLVGEAFMRAPEPGAELARLFFPA